MPEPSLLWCVAREGERYQVQKVGWEHKCVWKKGRKESLKLQNQYWHVTIM